MSKEMLIIGLGVWIIVLTQLGIPYHPWGVLLFAITGATLAVTGFLLRGEALSRVGQAETKHSAFIESRGTTPEPHEEKQGINSLN